MSDAEYSSTRDRLVAETIEAIEEGGEASVRIDRVARAAGVSKASVYHFFGGREGLVSAALAEAYRREMRRGFGGLEALYECTSQQQFLAVLLADVPTFATEEGAAARRRRIRILGSATSRPSLQEAIRAVHRDAVAELTKCVEFGQRHGWVADRFEAEVLAEWWCGFIVGRHLLDDYGRLQDHPDWLAATLTAVDALIGTDPAPPTPPT
jgi:AcrR family transcriptional regulator